MHLQIILDSSNNLWLYLFYYRSSTGSPACPSVSSSAGNGLGLASSLGLSSSSKNSRLGYLAIPTQAPG